MSLIAAYANDAVTITPRGPLGGDGRYSDGTPVVTTGWVNDRSGWYRNKDGTEITYTRVVYLKPDEAINEGDKVTYNGVTHVVVMVKRNNDVSNVSEHIKAMLA